MKKIFSIFVLSIFALTLTGCSKEEILDEGYDIPEEEFVNLNELSYSEYLSLNNPIVTITVKDMGEMKLQLFPNVAPNTVNSIIAYIESGVYTDNQFHRVIVDFMIQGGFVADSACNVEGEMTNNPGSEFVNDLSHYRGVFSLARVGGNYDSGSSQFFIVHENAPYLDDEYTTFGGMVSGFNILDFIASLNDGTNEIPSEEVIIESITVDLKGITYDAPICTE